MSSFGFGDGNSGSWETPSSPTRPDDGSSVPGGRPGWDDAAPDTDRLIPTRSGGLPVELWLGIGMLLTLLAIGLHLATKSSTLAAAGWLIGGPLAIVVLGVFVSLDTRRRADPWYRSSGFADWGRRLLVVLALVAVTLNAWRIADHLSRGHW